MINKKIIYLLIVILIVSLIAGMFNIYIRKPDKFEENKKLAIRKCIDLCYLKLSDREILEDGPCLSNKIIDGWVCDVAHQPRINWIDNKKQNMCSDYGKNGVNHFVEVTKNCKLIRAI